MDYVEERYRIILKRNNRNNGHGAELLSVLYPERCLVCGRVLWQDESGVCVACMDNVPLIKGERCIICSKSVAHNELYCSDCASVRHEYERGYALWSYNKVSGRIIGGLKYSGRKTGVDYITSELAYHVGALLRVWKAGAMLPVPLHRRKQKRRGFNQAGLLAEHIAAKTGIQYIDDVLFRVRYTRPQKNYDDKGRRQNLNNAFRVDEHRLNTYGITESVVLVDDIYTSGSTIDECSRALKKAGIKKVYFVCLCIGDGY